MCITIKRLKTLTKKKKLTMLGLCLYQSQGDQSLSGSFSSRLELIDSRPTSSGVESLVQVIFAYLRDPLWRAMYDDVISCSHGQFVILGAVNSYFDPDQPNKSNPQVKVESLVQIILLYIIAEGFQFNFSCCSLEVSIVISHIIWYLVYESFIIIVLILISSCFESISYFTKKKKKTLNILLIFLFATIMGELSIAQHGLLC